MPRMTTPKYISGVVDLSEMFENWICQKRIAYERCVVVKKFQINKMRVHSWAGFQSGWVVYARRTSNGTD